MKEVEKWQKTEEDRMRAASQQQLQGPNPDGSAVPPAPVSEEEVSPSPRRRLSRTPPSANPSLPPPSPPASRRSRRRW